MPLAPDSPWMRSFREQLRFGARAGQRDAQLGWALLLGLAASLVALPSGQLQAALLTPLTDPRQAVLCTLAFLATAIPCYILLSRLGNQSVAVARDHASTMLLDGGVLAAAVEGRLDESFQRGAGKGRWVQFTSADVERRLQLRLEFLVAGYPAACRQLRVRAWPATALQQASNTALYAVFVPAGLLLLLSHKRRHGFYPWALPYAEYVSSHPVLWKSVLGVFFLAVIVAGWNMSVHAAALRLAMDELLATEAATLAAAAADVAAADPGWG